MWAEGRASTPFSGGALSSRRRKPSASSTGDPSDAQPQPHVQRRHCLGQGQESRPRCPIPETPPSRSSSLSRCSASAAAWYVPPGGEGASCLPGPDGDKARAYMSLNDLSSASTHLARALEVDPHCPEAYMDLGQLRMQEGKVEEALCLYEKGVLHSRYLHELHDAMTCLLVAKEHLAAKEELGMGDEE